MRTDTHLSLRDQRALSRAITAQPHTMPTFVALEVRPDPPAAPRLSIAEVVVGDVSIRVPVGCDAAWLADVALRLRSHRASSAIEGFNAPLRPFLYLHKRATTGFLALFQAWYNLRPRRWGRFAGTSALELATGRRVDDWLTALGFAPSSLAAA